MERFHLKTESEEEQRSYSPKEVLAIMSTLRATTSDYLTQTYFTIFGIQDGPYLRKFYRRFNNIIFNNQAEITKQLCNTVFVRKAQDLLLEDLAGTSCVSCIYPWKIKAEPCPIIIQYFDDSRGIQHRLLGYTPRLGLNGMLSQFGILEKIVAFCGDFSYVDPGVSNNKSDHFSSLCLLSGNNVRYLPYSDGFIEGLIDLLVNYFPEDLTLALEKLGDTLTRITSKSQFVEDLVQEYKLWKGKGNKQHILLSNFTTLVIDNLPKLNCYLELYLCLTKSIEPLLNSVLQRFLLVFIKEIYLNLNEMKLADNNAVSYYFQLTKVHEMFKLYEDVHHIPPKALNFFNHEIDELVKNKQIHPNKDKEKINSLFADVVKTVDLTYTRAIHYLEPLLHKFEHFSSFTWILLQDSVIDQNQVHETYHAIANDTCHQCIQLFQEVKNLNQGLKQMQLIEMEHESLGLKWTTILKSCSNIPRIVQIIKHLLSLPASYNLTFIQMDDLQADCTYSRNVKIVQFNMTREPGEVVDNIDHFFGPHLQTAQNVIKSLQICPIID